MTRSDVVEGRAGRRAHHTRQRILRAARELITESGLERVRIEEIAERAKVGRSTFYLHFGSRAELANAIAIDEMETLTALWTELAGIDPADLAEVRGWLDRLIELWEANRNLTVISIEYRTDQRKLAAEMVDVQFTAANAFIEEMGRLGFEPAPSAIEEIRLAFLVAARFLYLHVSMQVPYEDGAVDAVAEHVRFSLMRARA